MSKKKIMLVEDDVSVSRILQLTIERQGHEVRCAGNGEVALKVMEEYWPEVLVTDINMPLMSGRDLCLQLHERYPDRELMIVVMTSMTERQEKEWIGQFPCIHFMEKPLSPKSLLTLIETAGDPTVEHG
jgi:CheY-like chemotaxis protein